MTRVDVLKVLSSTLRHVFCERFFTFVSNRHSFGVSETASCVQGLAIIPARS